MLPTDLQYFKFQIISTELILITEFLFCFLLKTDLKSEREILCLKLKYVWANYLARSYLLDSMSIPATIIVPVKEGKKCAYLEICAFKDFTP